MSIDIEKYEVEEIDHLWNVRIDIERGYNIIHSRSYGEFLFAIAETYGYPM